MRFPCGSKPLKENVAPQASPWGQKEGSLGVPVVKTVRSPAVQSASKPAFTWWFPSASLTNQVPLAPTSVRGRSVSSEVL
jgi:hypothetical protein